MRALVVLLILTASMLAGRVSGPSTPQPDIGAALPVNVWESGGLATYAETPEGVPKRSKADRLKDVVPPGAPQFAAFDQLMRAFMESHQVPTASVAVLREGQLRYQNAYGFLDQARTKPAGPDSMFRIASITKPFTAAVVATLVAQGQMDWDDPVFCLPPTPAPDCLLPIAPHPSRPVADARVAQVQLRHLVDHLTGWTRGPCTAPFFPAAAPIAIADEFGIPSPPPAWRLAQWFMGTPMQFDPGVNPGPNFDTYCNVGYTILGLIAEAKTRTTIAALYEAYLLRPLEVVGDVEPGNSLIADRNPREPFYACDGGMGRNVYKPDEQVCRADGGFDLAGLIAAGGLISTAAAVGAVYEVYSNNGNVRGPTTSPVLNGHTGGLPGTATTAWRFGDGSAGIAGDLQVVVFFNKSTGHASLPSQTAMPYQFQLLYGNLLAAVASAESRVP